jgi:hypothetical protein
VRTLFLLLLTSLAAFGADDDWAKVKTLKTGAELRVYKKGSKQPISAQLGELTDDSLVVIVKKGETAIPKDQIERVDARPASGSRWTKEKTATKDNVGPDGAVTSSESAGYSIGSKPDFETVYRRSAAAPNK